MKVIVLGGSPKGDQSVTMQYVKYLELNMPELEWNVVQVASRIDALERDESRFQSLIEEIAAADAVLWAFPLYLLLVCSQYKRFIELVFERKAEAAFSGKYAASLSTSIHFYDHTAHNYIQGISEDLGMQFVGSHSPAMEDLHGKSGRAALLAFGRKLEAAMRLQTVFQRQFHPVSTEKRFEYRGPQASGPQASGSPASVPATAGSHNAPIVILADRLDGNLTGMVARLASSMPQRVRVVELASVRTAGGCLGCLKCSFNNVCTYTGRDDYIETMREALLPAEVIVVAGTVVDRYYSWILKRFFDRSFFNTHLPWLAGKRFAFLASGPWSQLDNLREVMMGYVEFQRGEFIGSVSDECGSAEELDSLIDGFGSRINAMVESGVEAVPTSTFRGVAGMKIFRDEVYMGLRAIFRADHRYYRTHRVYDFPHRRIGRWFVASLLSLVTSIPAVQKRMRGKMPRMMVMQYRRALGVPPAA